MNDALILARAQFAFTMAFHIVFPSFTAPCTPLRSPSGSGTSP